MSDHSDSDVAPERLAGTAPASGAPTGAAGVNGPSPDVPLPAPPTPESSTLETAEAFARTQRRNLRWIAGIVAVLVAATVIGGLTYRTSYVALVPGSARDTEELVEVAGLDEYPSDGEVLFTTVRLRGRPNLWEYLWLTTQDDAEIVPEEVIYGDRTPDENREANLQAMTDSKQVAVAVALEELGYEAVAPTGVFVAQVVPDTAADGLLEVGDVILEIDGAEILTDADLVAALTSRPAGEVIGIVFERHGTSETATIEVELGGRDDDPQVGFLGVAPQTRVEMNESLPFEVNIDSGTVGGPSAGLAFTLAVLDQLTPGELTGGIEVAVTGTMAPDGTVGAVGGVPQKAAAVRERGIEVFLVPSALGEDVIADVRARAGSVQIIPVANLDEALEALAGLGGDTDAIAEFAAANP